MLRALVAIVATLCVYTPAQAQPTQCQFDVQCQSNYYCVPDAFVCRRCLDCEQLKRNPPQASTSCVKSVSECGSCIKGLVEDRNDVSAECVSPEDSNTTTWVIVVVVLVIIFVAVVIVIGVYLVRNIDTKIPASTTLQRAFNLGGGDPHDVAPRAPECPPPYYEQAPRSAPSSPSSPSSPENPAYLSDYEPQSAEDARPFIKRAPSTRLSDARESAGSQAAYMFNKPYYVRGPHLPSDSEASGGDTSAAPDDGARDDAHDVLAHDEDTMESTWSPDMNGNVLGSSTSGAGSATVSGGAGSAGGAGGSDMSTLLAAARSPVASRPWQDTNNNRNGAEAVGPSEGGVSSVVINVVQGISALQQINMFGR